MPLDYSFDREMPLGALRGLLAQMEWARGRKEDDIAVMLQRSLVKLGVWEGDDLVGFCRAFGDGVYRAVIDDVVVDEQHRNKGIGREMMRLLMERLAEVEVVTLGCEDDVAGFYERLGFKPIPSQTMWLPWE